MLLACLIVASCSNDDEPKQEISGEYLEATTWNAELSGTQTPIPEPISAHFVMQFLTKETGKCIPAYDDADYSGPFSYSITKNMITFNGSLVGNWTVVEHTDTKIALRSYQPKEFNLVLTKM